MLGAVALLAALACLPCATAFGAASRGQQSLAGGTNLATAGPSLGGAQALAAPAVTSPASGFQDTPAITGLTLPTVVRFASDGRIFVAEKSGLIKVFHGFNDTAPVIVADLRTQVDDYWDRGLLGFALDPNFPANQPLAAGTVLVLPPGASVPPENQHAIGP